MGYGRCSQWTPSQACRNIPPFTPRVWPVMKRASPPKTLRVGVECWRWRSFIRRILCSISIDRSNAYQVGAHGVVSPEVALHVAAVREDQFSREPARIIRGKKYGHACDVLGLADAAQGRTRDYLLLRLRSHDARRERTLRFGSTGIESVNADVSGAELF